MARHNKPLSSFVNLRGQSLNLDELQKKLLALQAKIRSGGVVRTPAVTSKQNMPKDGTPAAADRPFSSEDANTVWDALCLAGCVRSKTWMLAFLRALGRRTETGNAFDAGAVNATLSTLVAGGRVQVGVTAGYDVAADERTRALPQLLTQAWTQQAWRACAEASAPYSTSSGQLPNPTLRTPDEITALARLFLYSGVTATDFQAQYRQLLGYGGDLNAIVRGLCTPFMPGLWQQADPELHNLLLASVIRGADLNAPTLLPLLKWQDEVAATSPQRFAPELRLLSAERALLRGDLAGVDNALNGLRGLGVPMLRAAVQAQQGQWAAAAAAFEPAFKDAVKETRVKRGLFPARVMAWYAMALMASNDPLAWAAARKLCVAESGSRDPNPEYGWGLWAHAIAVRLGDAALQPGALDGPLEGRVMSNTTVTVTIETLELRAHRLVLAAWLNQAPRGWTAPALGQLVEALLGLELHSVAELVRVAASRLGLAMPDGQATPLAAWAEAFFGSPRETWRDALAAIEALGDSGVKPGASSAALQWHMTLDSHGRVIELSPFERTQGVRGLSKPKRVALARLKKSEQLAAADAAVARCISPSRFSPSKLRLDVVGATIALVGHPNLVLADAPDQVLDLREGLPQLEVRRQSAPATATNADSASTPAAEHFVFHLADDLGGPPPEVGIDYASYYEDLSPERERRNSIRVVLDAADRARLIRINPAQRRVAELVAKQWAVPVHAKAELDAALRVLAGHFQLHSDAAAGQDLPSEARLRALLSPQGDALQLRLVVQPFGDFGPALAPGQGRERLLMLHEGLNLATKRDLLAEVAHLDTVLDALPALEGSETGDSTWLLEDPEQALAVLEQLPSLPAISSVAWPRGKPVRVLGVAANALQVTVKSGTDWLGLSGELQLDEGRVLGLQKLLDMAHASRSGRFIALGEGEYLALTEQLKRQLNDLHALAQADGAGVKVPQAAAAWLAETLDAAVLKGDSAWGKRLKRLDVAAALQPEPPSALQAQLRGYQVEGYAWMVRLAESGLGACLADDMGLGKTVQTLGLLLNRAALGPALVLAPTSVCSNWVAEAARFAPGLKVAMYGEGERAALLSGLAAGDVVVASYALMQIDEEAFAKVEWASLVMDEAQALKNAATKRAKAVGALQAAFRLALSGTPVENRLADLWSIMNIINPGFLGSATRFSERFATPIERDRDEATRLRLRRLVSPFLLRRTKAQVLTDLPPRTEIIHRVEPGPEERAFLEATRRTAVERVAEAASSPPGQANFHVLAELTRLRRAACDPRLVAPELGIVGAKVHEFEQLATELVAGRHKALVFSQFTDFLKLLGERLQACGLSYQYLDGSTPAAERGKRVDAFQRGEGDLFLISLKAGGFGLNLTAADYVIIVDPWWNPAAEDQALGRAHRIGQVRPVTVYRLVTAGSVEERIVSLHHNKRQLADGILADQDDSAPLRADDLRDLLREVGT